MRLALVRLHDIVQRYEFLFQLAILLFQILNLSYFLLKDS
jgi:hypothetical protein